MKKILYRNLPEYVKALLLTSEGWLVGSAVIKVANGEKPTDYDIIVPSRELFQIAVKQLHAYEDVEITINSYGGIKCINDEGEIIDIWCEELDHYLKTTNKPEQSLYNHKRQIFLEVK